MADGNGNDDSVTDSAAKRWEYTNDFLAAALVLFAIGATITYIYRGQAVPAWLYVVDSLSITTAVVWAFGRGAFTAAKDAVSGD